MVRPPILKRPAILALAIIPLALTLSSCSNNDVQQKGSDIAQQIEGQNSKTQAKSVSAVGTWGPKEGSQEWETSPWIAFTKDGKFTSSNSGVGPGVSTIIGTWSQKGDTVDLVVISEIGSGNNAGPEITSADRAEISEDAVELYSPRGQKIVSIPFSSENPLLAEKLHTDAFMQKGADIAKQMEAQNTQASPSEPQKVTDGSAYKGRYG